MSPVSLRLATPDDAALLSRLAARLFEQTFARDNTAEDMAAHLATAYREDDERRGLESPDARTWLAVAPDAAEPVGYAQLRRARPGPGVEGRRAAEIGRIYVDATYHGRGVGHLLMDACLAQAAAWGCDVVWLGVWQRNPRAIAFYERRGFRAVGAQTFTLGRDVQDDWVMARPVEGARVL